MASVSTTVMVNAEDFDAGNDYDPVTSTFTAPVDGVYAFHARVGVTTANVDTRIFTQLIFGGATEVCRGSDTRSDLGNFTGNVLACTVQLDAGNPVNLSVFDTQVDAIEETEPQLTTFSGYLVGES